MKSYHNGVMMKLILSFYLNNQFHQVQVIDKLRRRFITGITTDDASDEDEGEEEDNDEGEEESEEQEGGEKKGRDKEFEKKKQLLKAKFDAEYDDDGEGGADEKSYFEKQKEELETRRKANLAELEALDEHTRNQIEGYRPGCYVRIRMDDMPFEFVQHFDPKYPLILGGLAPAEETFHFIQVKSLGRRVRMTGVRDRRGSRGIDGIVKS